MQEEGWECSKGHSNPAGNEFCGRCGEARPVEGQVIDRTERRTRPPIQDAWNEEKGSTFQRVWEWLKTH